MLTREQILSKMRGFDCPKYLTESCWQPIYDQCVAAIDLVAENERLKAKLAAVKAECLKPIMITSDVFGGGVAAGHNILKQAVLAIIKDGDNE